MQKSALPSTGDMHSLENGKPNASQVLAVFSPDVLSKKWAATDRLRRELLSSSQVKARHKP